MHSSGSLKDWSLEPAAASFSGTQFLKWAGQRSQTVKFCPVVALQFLSNLTHIDCTDRQVPVASTAFPPLHLQLKTKKCWYSSHSPYQTASCRFENNFPDRVFDVGIAEQHAVTFAAGLACEGLAPFCTIYSTFLQRGYDQIVHDVALQCLPGNAGRGWEGEAILSWFWVKNLSVVK